MQNPDVTLMTIAGFDPSSGAGVTADLMVFAAHSLFGTSAITSLTVQNTLGVKASHPVAAETLQATIDCLQDDLPPAGIKIGMLGTAANVAVVADYIESLREGRRRVPVVLDPVLRSTSGRELLDAAGVALLRDRLLPLVDWITPNLAELATLSGLPLTSRNYIVPACRSLQAKGRTRDEARSLGIIATGGKLDPPDDLLVTADGLETWLPGERIATTSTHGTGCAFSSAFLCWLVLGEEPEAAASSAKRYVTEALRTAIPRGGGHGPLNHTWPFQEGPQRPNKPDISKLLLE